MEMAEKTTKVARRDSRYLWNFFEESKGVGKDLCSKCEGREGRNGTERRKCGRGNDRNRQAKGNKRTGRLRRKENVRKRKNCANERTTFF